MLEVYFLSLIGFIRENDITCLTYLEFINSGHKCVQLGCSGVT